MLDSGFRAEGSGCRAYRLFSETVIGFRVAASGLAV